MQNIMLTSILAVLGLILFFSFYMLYRNSIVFKERMRLIKEISNLSQIDINDMSPDFMKWYDKWSAGLSYNDMMWQLTKVRWTLDEVFQGKE